MTTAEVERAPEVRVIKPSRGLAFVDLRELWHYRDLFWMLTLRDLKVRYRQTLLGLAWAMVPPLALMAVFTFWFGRVAKLYSEGKPYALLVLAGFVIWLYFMNAVTFSANSLVSNSALITKVYFPRLFAPLAPVLSALIDLVLALVVLIAVMAVYGMYPAPHRAWIALPVIVLAATTALAVGMWLSALNAQYRDVRYGVPFLLQLWMFATPVFYSAALLKDTFRFVYQLNPMVAVVEWFRWSMIGGVRPGFDEALLAGASALVLLVTGILYFRRMERTFADVI
jgi:lipopolysaccharide transport system permease protein